MWPNLPTWLTVQDRDVLEGLYYGQASPYTAEILRAWATPALLVDRSWSAPSCGWGSA